MRVLINAINLELFEGDDENLYGKFEANIPDQFIQGSMYVSDGVIIKTNLEIDLSQTINDQRYFGIKGKEAFKPNWVVSMVVAGRELLGAKWRMVDETDEVPHSQVLVKLFRAGVEFGQFNF